MEIPIYMRFVPGGTRVLDAHGNHVKRSNLRAVPVDRAVIRREAKTRIAAWVRRRSTWRWIKLGQAIESLVGNTVGGPVLAHGAEVVIEATVFLGHENDVIDALQVVGRVALVPHQTTAAAQDDSQSH